MARVLVVDDDLTVREVLASYLRAGSHDVVEAGDGEQALRARFGGVEVMRGQLAHLLAATERAGLLLGILPSRAELAGLPGHSFGIFDGKLVHVETIASGLDITDEADLAVYEKAFALLQRSAVYGDAARDLIREELAALR